MRPISAAAIKLTSALKRLRLVKSARSSTHSKITGVRMSVAAPSANHKLVQWTTESAESRSFVKTEVASATVELMAATGRKEINEKVATSRAVANGLSVVDERFVKAAPINPATTVPMAIKLAIHIGRPAKTCELKQPAKIAGQIRFPFRRVTAKARPLGVQTSVLSVFDENDRAPWTNPKKIAPIIKNSITESAALLTLPIV